jgi:hypothetical protein
MRQTALLLAGLATLSFTAAACGGGSPMASHTTATTAPASASGGSQNPQSRQAALLKYATCMRSHGVSNFPDPSNGFLTLPAGVDPQSIQSANQTCGRLLPNGGSTQVTSPQNLAGQAKYAACMTKHGVPMSADGRGTLDFGNADPNSPQFQSANQACKNLVPAGLP